MDKKLDKLAELIDDVVKEMPGDTYKEKARRLRLQLEERGCEQLGEFTSWLVFTEEEGDAEADKEE